MYRQTEAIHTHLQIVQTLTLTLRLQVREATIAVIIEQVILQIEIQQVLITVQTIPQTEVILAHIIAQILIIRRIETRIARIIAQIQVIQTADTIAETTAHTIVPEAVVLTVAEAEVRGDTAVAEVQADIVAVLHHLLVQEVGTDKIKGCLIIA